MKIQVRFHYQVERTNHIFTKRIFLYQFDSSFHSLCLSYETTKMFKSPTFITPNHYLAITKADLRGIDQSNLNFMEQFYRIESLI